MTSPPITTAVKLLETLPEPEQALVVEHLREYIAELHDEEAWEALFEATQPQLVQAARAAKDQIKAGMARPLEEHDL